MFENALSTGRKRMCITRKKSLLSTDLCEDHALIILGFRELSTAGKAIVENFSTGCLFVEKVKLTLGKKLSTKISCKQQTHTNQGNCG